MQRDACARSGLFGTPGQGVHALRVGGLAAVDLAATAGVAVLAGIYVSRRRGPGSKASTAAACLLLFVLLLAASVALHEHFRVNTRLSAALFGRPWPGPHPACTPSAQ